MERRRAVGGFVVLVAFRQFQENVPLLVVACTLAEMAPTKSESLESLRRVLFNTFIWERSTYTPPCRLSRTNAPLCLPSFP